MASRAKIQHSVNKWGARTVPILLFGLVGFGTWVIVVLLAVNSLLFPPNSWKVQQAPAIVIIILYFILLVPICASYLRLLHVIFTNPGYVPLPKTKTRDRHRKHHRRRSTSQNIDPEKTVLGRGDRVTTSSQNVGYLDRAAVSGGRDSPPRGLENFYKRDIFECEVDGLPRWCSSCKNWKPDRTHHSTEIGRCVYKMDHFCPWAGGMISETNFKFFVQFCWYALLFCLFVLVVSAYYMAHLSHKSNLLTIVMIVCTALSAMFTIFAFGMGYNSLQAILTNSTTVDLVQSRTRVHHFAVLISEPVPTISSEDENAQRNNMRYQTITYPFPESESAAASGPRRTFAVLAMPNGRSPYRLSSSFENFKSVMGNTWWDWILPFKYSPCCDHLQFRDSHQDAEKGRSGVLGPMYRFGPAMDRIIKEAGLPIPRGLGV